MKHIFLLLILQFSLVAVPSANTKPPQKSGESPQTEHDIADPLENLEEEKSDQYQTLDDAQFQKNFVKTLIAILVIIVLALLALWIIKKMSVGRRFTINHKKSIKILESRAISGQTILYHLEIGGKQLIMAESKCSVKTITELDWALTEKKPANKL